LGTLKSFYESKLMTTTFKHPISSVDYPESDGLTMAESDAARDYLIYSVESLKIHFQNHPQVYVSGNLFIYYEEGNPKAAVAPDVFVVFGAEKKQRLSYKVWAENDRIPDFILEITSKSTASQDRGTKKGLYAYLGVKEYFQFDPTADYLQPSLQGFRLVDGNYLPMPSQEGKEQLSIESEVLGLELWLQADGAMRFYDPTTGEKLLSPQELAQARFAQQQKSSKLADKLRQLGIDPDSI